MPGLSWSISFCIQFHEECCAEDPPTESLWPVGCHTRLRFKELPGEKTRDVNSRNVEATLLPSKVLLPSVNV